MVKVMKRVQGFEDSRGQVKSKKINKKGSRIQVVKEAAAAFRLCQSTLSLRAPERCVAISSDKVRLLRRYAPRNDDPYRWIWVLAVFIISMLFLTPSLLYADSGKERPHGDKTKLLKGCASCHKGHGIYNTPMLSERKELYCFRCHGQGMYVEKAKNDGDVARDAITSDIQREFEKPYHHPIEKIGIHRYGEILPEVEASMPRHIACGDCHHHHYVKKENKMSGIQGTNKDGLKLRITSEYELCFNCHSHSANLPADQTNKAEIFNISNPSFHPVITYGKNTDVPSLVPPLTTSSQITCTDCHNNDDPGGPKGPHGSSYRYMLSKNYTTVDSAEGSFQYELCYSCHRRNSILSNEGFQLHDLHISAVGTSCRSCHNPHGSIQYTHLIEFNRSSVTPSNSGQLGYTDFGSRAGQCFLNCHGKDHDPAVYPGAAPTYSPSRYPSRVPFKR
jgi:predicted CXXCH cytochrome family protein